MREVTPLTVREYLHDGRNLFRSWLMALKDRKVQAIIKSRVDRLTLGHMGDSKAVGQGVFELRINHGPGYRIYFGFIDQTVVLLLLGGDKRTQRSDIERAQRLWVECRSIGK